MATGSTGHGLSSQRARYHSNVLSTHALGWYVSTVTDTVNRPVGQGTTLMDDFLLQRRPRASPRPRQGSERKSAEHEPRGKLRGEVFGLPTASRAGPCIGRPWLLDAKARCTEYTCRPDSAWRDGWPRAARGGVTPARRHTEPESPRSADADRSAFCRHALRLGIGVGLLRLLVVGAGHIIIPAFQLFGHRAIRV